MVGMSLAETTECQDSRRSDSRVHLRNAYFWPCAATSNALASHFVDQCTKKGAAAPIGMAAFGEARETGVPDGLLFLLYK